jgi:hypothetical protein
MKFGSASVATSEIQNVFLRRASRNHSGEGRKNEPKMPDALDVGPDGASIFPKADAHEFAMSGRKHP